MYTVFNTKHESRKKICLDFNMRAESWKKFYQGLKTKSETSNILTRFDSLVKILNMIRHDKIITINKSHIYAM